jgi:predicted phage tail protein
MSPVLIPILTSLFFWSFVATVIMVPLYMRHLDRRQTHQTVRAMVSQGQEVPPELIASLQGERPKDSVPNGLAVINAGTIVAYLGAGVIVFAAVLAAALWWNAMPKGATIAGGVIAAGGLTVCLLGLALMAVGRRTLQHTANTY